MGLSGLGSRYSRHALGALSSIGLIVLAVCVAASSAVAQRVQGFDTSSAANGSSPTQAMWNAAYNEGMRFAFVRSSRGGTTDVRVDDTQYYDDVTRGTAAGLLIGSYHFVRPDSATHTAVDDANHYLQRAGMYMKPGYLLPSLDLEAGNGLSQTDLTNWCLDFVNTIFNAKGINPIVYANASYVNDEVNAQLAWVNSGTTPKTVPKTYLWIARPEGDRINGDPVPAQNYPNNSGVWDPNFVTRTNSRDPAVAPWAFWQASKTTSDPSGIVVDYDVANGNIEFVKDFLVPALWTNSGGGDWSTISNWNSDNPTYVAGNTSTGPAPRLPNNSNLDWVKLQNAGGGTVTISSGAQTVRKFYTQQPLNITGGSLAVSYVPGSGGKFDVPSEFSAPVTISGAGAYSAHTTQIDPAAVLNINGGTLTFTDMQLVTAAAIPSGKIVMAGDATFDQTGGNVTSVIRTTGSVGLPGTLSLSAGNRTFTVNNGTASVDLNVRAAVTGAGRLVKSGPGTMQLSATNSYSGGTTVSGGVLQLAADDRLGTAPGSAQPDNIILDGGTLRAGAQINSISLTNPGTHYTAFPTLTIGGAGANALPASANVLAGIDSIVVTSGGTGYVSQTPSSPPVAGSAATFVDIVGGGGTGATAYATVVAGTIRGITIMNPGTGYTSIPTIHVSSAVSSGFAGSGAVAVVGTLALQGIALNDGGFDYSSPTISLTGGGLGSGATASASSSSALTLNSNRGISLTANGGTLEQTAGTTLFVNGPISSTGNGVLTKSGAGMLVLGGANSYSGGTVVSAGLLLLGSPNSSLGTGNVTVQGMTAGTALEIVSGVTNAIDDSATLTLLGGGTPGVADQGYVFLNPFVSEIVHALSLGGVLQAPGTYGATGSGAANIADEFFTGAGIVSVVSLAGDFNADGVVNSADYVLWRENVGQPSGTLLNDTTGAVVGDDQYNLWRAHFGDQLSSGSGSKVSGAAVPEPSSIGLLVFLLAIFSRRGCRR